MNYVKRHVCEIIRTSNERQLPAPMTISSYYHAQSQQETRNSQQQYQESEQKQAKMDFVTKVQSFTVL